MNYYHHKIIYIILMKQQIINKLSQFNIIGLGENSHYVNFPTKYRLELFKSLSYQSNFNIIFLETDIFYASIANAYIHSIINTDPQIIVENLFYMWRSPIIVQFLNWAREYNSQVHKFKQIHFIGYDSQNPFLFRKNKIIKPYIIKDTKYYYKKIFNVKKKYINNFIKLYSSGYERKYGDTKLYDKHREKLSFDIFMLHYQYILPKNKKIVIIAHQSHLSKIKSESFPYGPFGYYIYKKFKNKFYSLAMDILSGKLACKAVLKGVNINYGIKIKKVFEVSLIDNNYHYSNECDQKSDQYTINPLKYHDAVLVFTNDTPYTVNNTTKYKQILKKISYFFKKNNTFDIINFYKKYLVDIPNKYINHLSV